MTIKDCLKLADDCHNFIDMYSLTCKLQDLEKNLSMLQIIIKNIQSVAKRMADVSNIINRSIIFRKQDGKMIKYIDPYPTENDHTVLRFKYPEPSFNIIKDINIPVKYVEKTSDIPVTSLYYNKELKQFCINVNGVIIKGNLGNILSYKNEKTVRCDYGSECKSLIKSIACKYYHEPEDYKKLNMNIPDETRNFTVGSFIYTNNRSIKTYYARHVGNASTMEHDISMLKKVSYKEEIFNREGQLMHDLLVYMILVNKGLVDKYPHWF
jgi:hypothetical protein